MTSKTTMALRRLALCAVPLVLMSGLATAPARAQDATAAVPATAQTQTQTEAQLPEGQIEQLVAPIALYPDPLLTQVLMASTYPLEVVEAARWSQDNSTLSGQALQDAMQGQSWDPSVKALTAVPQTLQMMNAKRASGGKPAIVTAASGHDRSTCGWRCRERPAADRDRAGQSRCLLRPGL
jgi:hypothetical protein